MVDSEFLISAKGIYKSYSLEGAETSVLKGVDLNIGRRSLMTIVGASGAGKSTLLYILGSLDPPSKGDVFFEGENLYQKKEEELAFFRNRSMGFVFQFHHLLPELTALENVCLPLWIRSQKEKPAVVRERGLGIMKKLGLDHRAHHKPMELSGGEQQRVAVARALIGSPRILFADEPTGNLDVENGQRLIDLLFQIHGEREMALVLVTHNPAIAARFPVKIFIENGQIRKAEG